MKKSICLPYASICISSLIYLWSIESSSAFATTRQSYLTPISPSKASKPLTVVGASAGAALPNPFQKLPWNARKEREREERRLKLEKSRLHREIGINEDATYEEICEATDILISRAGDDIKQKIKIEVAKDKILQIRLNERLAGLSELSKDVRAQSNFEDGEIAEATDEEKAKEKINLEQFEPSWLKGIIVKPDKARLIQQGKIWGISTGVVWILPPLVVYMKVIGAFFCVMQIMLRGVPKGSITQGGFGRSTYPHSTKSFLLGISAWTIGSILGIVLLPTWADGQRWTELVQFTIKNVICFIACIYLHPYKDPNKKTA